MHAHGGRDGGAVREKGEEDVEDVAVDDEEEDEHRDRGRGDEREDGGHGDHRLLHTCN